MEVVVALPKMEPQTVQEEKYFDSSPRAIWLRAIVVGGHEGVTHATVMLMGIGMLANGIKAMLLTSFIGLVAGTLNLAIAQYVSVYTQYDIMTFQAKRNMRMGRGGNRGTMPSPTLVAVASSLAYLVGGSVPLPAAGFIEYQKCRFSVAITVACISMFVVGVIGATLGKAPVARSCLRVLLGGWLTISIMWGRARFLLILDSRENIKVE